MNPDFVAVTGLLPRPSQRPDGAYRQPAGVAGGPSRVDTFGAGLYPLYGVYDFLVRYDQHPNRGVYERFLRAQSTARVSTDNPALWDLASPSPRFTLTPCLSWSFTAPMTARRRCRRGPRIQRQVARNIAQSCGLRKCQAPNTPGKWCIHAHRAHHRRGSPVSEWVREQVAGIIASGCRGAASRTQSSMSAKTVRARVR